MVDVAPKFRRPLSLTPRLITGPAATHYLGGERPERFGVQPIMGKRQRLYDLRAIDAALDAWSRLEAASPKTELEQLIDEWR